MKKMLVLSICILSVASAFLLFSSISSTTTVTIENKTNETITNLTFCSNDNEKDYEILAIPASSCISFEYDIGGHNENSACLKHMTESGSTEIYIVIDYVCQYYSNINIDILSVSDFGKLDIQVENSNLK